MKPQIVVYCCANSTTVPEKVAEGTASEEGVAIKMVRLPCSGRTDVLHIVRAFEEGAHMAVVVGCPEGQCQFLEGSTRARMRVKYANRLLAEAGLGRERVIMVNQSPDQGEAFAATLRETVKKARELGPWLSAKP
jgi:coenzyme F420-reducing hydrogenase delta subunit